MKTYLWKIKKDNIVKTNLALYSNFIEKKYKIKIENNFNKLWEWSIKNSEDFWKSIWDFTEVKGKIGNISIKKSNIFYKNKFFPKATLNYAENLLKKKDTKPAIIFKSENGYRTELSWQDLNLNVQEISNWMISSGVKKGDRIAAYLPNIPETGIAYLSTSTIGAIWSSCSPDLGTAGVVFSQKHVLKVAYVCSS